MPYYMTGFHLDQMPLGSTIGGKRKRLFFTALGSTLLCENVSFRVPLDPEMLLAESWEALVPIRKEEKSSTSMRKTFLMLVELFSSFLIGIKASQLSASSTFGPTSTPLAIHEETALEPLGLVSPSQ